MRKSANALTFFLSLCGVLALPSVGHAKPPQTSPETGAPTAAASQDASPSGRMSLFKDP